MVFGDLHPGNVMVRPDGRLTLVDFEPAFDAESGSACGLGAPGFFCATAREGTSMDDYALACMRLFFFLPLTFLNAPPRRRQPPGHRPPGHGGPPTETARRTRRTRRAGRTQRTPGNRAASPDPRNCGRSWTHWPPVSSPRPPPSAPTASCHPRRAL
ncbi:hypothetical protein [Streptomyces sp. PsTaAH-124]|uniref:hypothetical protein n=1 Tax=Streptomyces sp. PsTaAH-124 TaxID=1157638 RepID=UPI00039A8AAE